MKDAYFLLALYGVSRCQPVRPPPALAQQPAANPQQLHTVQYSGRTVVAARALFKPKTPLSSQQLAAIAAETSAAYLEPLGGAGWYRLDSSNQTVVQLISSLKADTSVAKVEPDFVGKPMAGLPAELPTGFRPMMFNVPSDPDYSLQWAFQNTGQTVYGTAGTPGADINAPSAWNLETGNHNFAILDIDTGIDLNNPDLQGSTWSAPLSYTINEGGTVYTCSQGSHGFSSAAGDMGCSGQVQDDDTIHGHGTLMAGIMGAVTNNSLGVAGTDWNSTIIAIKACNPTCTSSQVVTGIDAALQIGAQFTNLKIVAANMSHGDLDGGALQSEMLLAGQNGIVFAASTGDDCGTVGSPASFYLPNEIAVGASDQFDQVGHWTGGCSNAGGNIAAPGVTRDNHA